MKRRLPCFVTLALVPILLGASPVQAQKSRVDSPSPVRIGVFGGLALPAGDLGNAADVGFGLGLRVEGRAQAPGWALRGDLSWDRFDGRRTVNAYSYTALAGNLVHRERSGRFYEFGGLGVYNSRVAFVDGFDASDTNLGVQLGLGADLTSVTPRLFAELGLTSAFTSGRSSIWFPVRIGFWF
ncbi:MAG: hypothetical protein ACYC3L_09125 [Gemmatimonadaceae bacterium]